MFQILVMLKKIKIIICVAFFIIILKYNNVLFMSRQSKTIKNTLNNDITTTNRTKYILYWTDMFRHKDFYLGFGSQIFENCSVKNCYTTNDKTLMPIEHFDAILFHGAEYTVERYGKPEKRNPHQVYVFSNQESPEFHPYIYESSEKWFYNWTMTYRSDSDIVRNYASAVKRNVNYKMPIDEITKRPNKIAWLVSHCDTVSKREIIYEKLRQFIEIDKYGHCKDGLNCSGRMSEECYDYLEQNYKFYLSFENAICDEYVTEKLFNILKRNLVPIVYGGADYKKCAPPHSYINVEDFDTVEQLAEYLNYLLQNTEEYLKYFEWKHNYTINDIETTRQNIICIMCEKLNKQPLQTKIYEDIVLWWTGGNKPKCRHDMNLPDIVFN